MHFLLAVQLILLSIVCHHSSNGTLFPRDTETRETKTLDGVWNFRIIPNGVDQNIGFTEKWYLRPLKLTGDVIPMPVPSSYQDIVQQREIMDYWGYAWYDYQFVIPQSWSQTDRITLLRFSSVRQDAIVFVNGHNVVNHTGGNLPFEADITEVLLPKESNLITVVVNNVLTQSTIPQGSIVYENDTTQYPKGFTETTQHFDFFNYAGIDRHVHLYNIPETSIRDIVVYTSYKSDNVTGTVTYWAGLNKKNDSLKCLLEVFDDKDSLVTSQTSMVCNNSVDVPNVNLWWPFTMNKIAGYLYTLKFTILNEGRTVDVYSLKIGIREISVTNTQFRINGKPFYFRGFGKHEDSNIRGKGIDLPLIIKDYNLIKWLGANSFRTSHYPYSEEMMDEADAQGIVVIDEIPATGLDNFSDDMLKQHQKVLAELIARDKNRPSVVMWSVANEPASDRAPAEEYFKSLIQYGKPLDQSRPFSATTDKTYNQCLMAKSLDVLMINRYYGWYTDQGYTSPIVRRLTNDLENWHKSYAKPMLVSEYGADTSTGLHNTPSHIYSEDFQTEVIMETHKVFDQLRKNDYFIGELIWNFADFKCNRAINQNWGILTRDRKPKASAKVIRCRYWKLAGLLQDMSDSDMYCAPN